jgi:hypothetical protein
VYERIVLSEITGFEKSAINHVTQISWDEHESIEEKFHNETQTRFSEMKIRVIQQNNSKQQDDRESHRKREICRNPESEWQTGMSEHNIKRLEPRADTAIFLIADERVMGRGHDT